MSPDDFWSRLREELGLMRIAPASRGMALASDMNGTHFLVYDPTGIPPDDRAARLAEILADPAAFALGY